jgi:hypothetical protein
MLLTLTPVPRGPAEGLNCAVEVHVEERILVAPDSRTAGMRARRSLSAGVGLGVGVAHGPDTNRRTSSTHDCEVAGTILTRLPLQSLLLSFD